MEITLSSEKITELARTMISVQLSLVPALKDGINTYTESSYATLKSVMEVCRTALLSHGIWMTQYPVSVEAGHLGLVTKIVHAESGQWQSSLIEMPLPKNDPQGYGSAITYARRYGLSALIGITTEDDDAESAMPKGQTKEQGLPPSGEQSEKMVQGKNQQEADNIIKTQQLPRLDGVKYRTQKDQNGKERVVAMGKTHAKKEFLKTFGFKWDNKDKVWWRYANAA
ncbi:ERF family protein [Desulfopila sp. IMCC35006]|uniref:ERF family protein n=1 Tax=Desulfopila sp. IMCC35006 TaxID=2569542 RepID=UPI0010AD9B20|nr:ERF family protein [Desulfopila sp. IMCC35006]TKB25162.1 ERF family protein [Desulfopila sp. IMCC35006]